MNNSKSSIKTHNMCISQLSGLQVIAASYFMQQSGFYEIPKNPAKNQSLSPTSAVDSSCSEVPNKALDSPRNDSGFATTSNKKFEKSQLSRRNKTKSLSTPPLGCETCRSKFKVNSENVARHRKLFETAKASRKISPVIDNRKLCSRVTSKEKSTSACSSVISSNCSTGITKELSRLSLAENHNNDFGQTYIVSSPYR